MYYLALCNFDFVLFHWVVNHFDFILYYWIPRNLDSIFYIITIFFFIFFTIIRIYAVIKANTGREYLSIKFIFISLWRNRAFHLQFGIVVFFLFLIFLMQNVDHERSCIWADKGNIGFIDKEGKTVIPPIYYGTSGLFSEGLVDVEMPLFSSYVFNDKFHLNWPCISMDLTIYRKKGFIDKNGTMKIPPQCFYSVGNFTEGLVFVQSTMCGGWGYMNRDGQIAIPPQFDFAGDFFNGLAIAKQDEKYGLINKMGEWVVAPQFQNIRRAKVRDPCYKSFDHNTCLNSLSNLYLIQNQKKENWGIMNSAGKILIEPEFDDIKMFQDGVAVMYQRKKKILKIGIINEAGEIVIPPTFEVNFATQLYFFDGFLPVKLENKYGYINTKGQIQILPQYDDAAQFSEGLAAVKKENKWGYINTEGKIVILPQFDDKSFFLNGFAEVRLNKKNVIIDKNGNPLFLGDTYSLGRKFGEMREIRTYKNSKRKSGFIDKNGKILIPLIYDSFSTACPYWECGCESELGQVWIQDTPGYLNKQGKLVIQLNHHLKACGVFFCDDRAFIALTDNFLFKTWQKFLLRGYYD